MRTKKEKTTNLQIVAMFLAKFTNKQDDRAIKDLGFKNQDQAFEQIGKKLGYKKTSVKNRRDSFDPLIAKDKRKGWDPIKYKNYINQYRVLYGIYKNLKYKDFLKHVKDILEIK